MAAPPEPQDQAPEEGEGLLIVKVEDSSWEQDPAQPEDHGDPEACRRRFRQFCYGDAGGPHEAFSQLWELCCRWLRPELSGLHARGEGERVLALESRLASPSWSSKCFYNAVLSLPSSFLSPLQYCL